jgi:glycosyltransferase involved in cell wall biosynthesis
MKIAVAAPSEIPARRANTMQIMKMMQAFIQLGHDARLASPSASKPPAPDSIQEWEALCQHYGLRSDFPFKVEKLHAASLWRRYDFGLRSVIWARSWQADLLYTRLAQAAAIASFIGLPTILEVHDLPQGTAGPWLFRRFLKGRGARRLVAITHALKADLASAYDFSASPPFTIIAADGVDLERYRRVPGPAQARRQLLEAGSLVSQAKALQVEAFIAGYTGHLYPGRGSELLLELAGRLPDIVFLIAGGEPKDIAQFQERIQSLGLHNIILAGFVPNADLPCYQAACDLLLMPYQQRVEASSGGDIARYLSPMKLFEYLACERPILSSDLPVLREVLNAQNAWLLPSDDGAAWAAAIRTLQHDPLRCASLAARARHDAQQYTWESRAASILAGMQPA